MTMTRRAFIGSALLAFMLLGTGALIWSPLIRAGIRGAVSEDPLSGSSWTPVGPAPILNGQGIALRTDVSGRLNGVAAHPSDPNTIYVAADGGGVWKTSNGGHSWRPLTDSIATTMASVAIARSNPLVVYAGTGGAGNGPSNFGIGVLVSTNGGETWTVRNPNGAFSRRSISSIAVHPTNPAIAYISVGGMPDFVGGTSNQGVWKTTNGGVTWTNKTAAISNDIPWFSVRINPVNPNIVYASAGAYNESALCGVYKSIDGGNTWTLLTSAPQGFNVQRIELGLSSDGNTLYVLTQGGGTPVDAQIWSEVQFLRSDDAGETFTDFSDVLNTTAAAVDPGSPEGFSTQSAHDFTVGVDPSDASIVYASGQRNFLRSTDGGASWTDVAVGPITAVDKLGPHVDHTSIVFDANGKLLDGGDGGIMRLDDPVNVVWTDLNGDIAALNTVQFIGIGLHPTNPAIVIGGNQDNAYARSNGEIEWENVGLCGDGGYAKFSPTNPSRAYRAGGCEFSRSDDGGVNWDSKFDGITDGQGGYPAFFVDPTNGDHVLYGLKHVWETFNGGETWSPVGDELSGGDLGPVAMSPADPNTIYHGKLDGGIWVTTDHGANWIPRDLPGSSPWDIQVQPDKPSVAYATVGRMPSNCSLGSVYKTTNAGATWVDITGDLPRDPGTKCPYGIYSLQMDPDEPTKLYVSGDAGVFRSSNGGKKWKAVGKGFPKVRVTAVVLNKQLGILAAGTYGRGVWEILLENDD